MGWNSAFWTNVTQTACVLRCFCLKLWGWFSANQQSLEILQAAGVPQEVVFVIQSAAPCPLSQRWAKVHMRFWSVEYKTEVMTAAATGKFTELLTRTGILTATSQIPDKDIYNFPPLTSLGE